MVILDYYRIFYYVAQYKSFTKAAEALDNSQPNITRCMNLLENELGCRLFVRSNRGVSLTPEGETLFHYVSVGYKQILAGEKQLRKERNLEEGLITVGASEIALRLLLLDKLEAFHEQYPHIQLQLLNCSAPLAVRSLCDHLVDFSVIATPVKIKKPLTKIPLSSFREILIGGVKYSSFAETKHHLYELQELPIISLGKETSTRQFHQQFFMDHNLTFRPEMTAATTDQILPMVQHNLGIGFYPKKLTSHAFERKEIVEIPLYESLPEREICLLQNSTHSLSLAAQKFIELLLQHPEHP